MTHIPRARRAARTAARLAPAFLLLALTAAPAAAQSLSGRVTRGGEGEAGVSVELHRVSTGARGVVGRATTGPGGEFRIPLPPADTAQGGFNVVFATAVVDGVRYFGPALHPGESPDGYQVAVYDTTSAAAAADSVRVTRRDVFLIPEMSGGWEVAEVVRVRNGAGRTLVAAGGKPAVGLALPGGVSEFQAGDAATDSLVEPGLVQMGERVWLTDPLVPGERDLFFRYRLPAGRGRAALPLAQPTDTLNVYVRQPSPSVRVAGLIAQEPFEAEGERFLRFAGTALAPGARVAVDWRAASGSPVDPRWAALALAAAILAAGAALAVRRGRAAG